MQYTWYTIYGKPFTVVHKIHYSLENFHGTSGCDHHVLYTAGDSRGKLLQLAEKTAKTVKVCPLKVLPHMIHGNFKIYKNGCLASIRNIFLKIVENMCGLSRKYKNLFLKMQFSNFHKFFRTSLHIHCTVISKVHHRCYNVDVAACQSRCSRSGQSGYSLTTFCRLV